MSANAAAVLLQAPPAGPDMSLFLMLGTIFLIFYLLVFRPQNKKQKDLDASIKAATKGDRVVTAGGMHGRVYAAGENTLTLEIANVKGTGVRVEIDRSRIERVVKPGESKEAEAKKSKEAEAKKSKKSEKGGEDS